VPFLCLFCAFAAPLLAEFANLLSKPPRSKLEPHRELTRELRRKGYTYRELSRLLEERLGLHVAPSPLHSFVKVRAKHRKRTQFELSPLELSTADSPVLDRVAALRMKPAVQAGKRVRFAFSENKSLTLTNNGGALVAHAPDAAGHR